MSPSLRLVPTSRSARSSWLGAPGELLLLSTSSSLAHHQHPRTRLHTHPQHARTHHHRTRSASVLFALSRTASRATPTTLVSRSMHGVFLLSSSGFPPFSWPAFLSFFLLRVAPAALSFCLLRVAPCAMPARKTKTRSLSRATPARKQKHARSALASAHTDDRRTNETTCGPQAWLTGRLHDGGIRSVRSPLRRAPLLATPIAKPLQCGRP